MVNNNKQLDSSDKTSLSSPSRRRWLKTVGTGSIAALAGCSGSDDGDGSGDGGGDGNGDGGDGGTTGTANNAETVIEYWRWPHSTEPSNDGENAIVESFNEMDNGIRVKQVRTPFQDYPTKLKSAIGSGNAPAVGWNLAPGNLYETAGKSRKEVANNAPYAYLGDRLNDSFMDQFWQTFWDRQSATFKGIVTVPFVGGVDPGLFYINVDAWNEAGLGDLPTDGWSIEEWHNAVEQLNGTSVNGTDVAGYILGLKDITNRNRWVEVMVKGRSMGKIIDEGYQNQDDEYVLTFADDAMEEAWNAWYGTHIENGWSTDPSAYTAHETVQQFYEGQAATAQLFTWARAGIAQNADFEWAVVPFPTRDGNDYWLRNASGAGMSAFKDEVGGNVEAATEFIQYRTAAEQAFEFFNISGQSVPNRDAYQMMKDNPDELSDFVKESKAVSVMDAMNSAFESLADLSDRRQERYSDIKSTEIRGVTSLEMNIPRGAGGGQLQQQTGNSMQRLVAGQVEPKEGLTNIEEQWQQVLSSDDYTVDGESVGFNKPTPAYDWA